MRLLVRQEVESSAHLDWMVMRMSRSCHLPDLSWQPESSDNLDVGCRPKCLATALLDVCGPVCLLCIFAIAADYDASAHLRVGKCAFRSSANVLRVFAFVRCVAVYSPL
jgi:hypothetical protein